MFPEILLVEPDEQEFERWLHSHYTEHFQIISAIKQQRQITLQILPVHYFSQGDLENFLFLNQSLHNDMNGVLGVTGSDLLDVDFKNDDQRKAWAFLHAQEHIQATQKLGI